MANQFIARKGLISLSDAQITGSLSTSAGLIVDGNAATLNVTHTGASKLYYSGLGFRATTNLTQITGTSSTDISLSGGFIKLTGGNVGIGTTSPAEKLEVTGNIAITGNPDSGRYIMINETNTGETALYIQAGAGSAAYGGGIALFGHAHDSRAGYVTAGISTGSGGKFTVNASGIATGADVFTVDASGNVDMSAGGHLYLKATKKLYLDSGGDTYIHERSANHIGFIAGGTEVANFNYNSGNEYVETGQDFVMPAAGKLYLDGRSDTYITEHAANYISFYCADALAAFAAQGAFVLPATNKLFLDGGSDTYFYQYADNNVRLVAGTVDALSIGSNGIVFNEDSQNWDFRIESNDNANMFTIDGGDNTVGIGTAPKAVLHVKNTGNNWEDGVLLEHDSGNTGWNIHPENDGDNALWFGYNADTSQALTSQNASARMVIHSDGHVGIGTTSPAEALHIQTASGDCNLRMQGDAVRLKKSGTDFLAYDGTNWKASVGGSEIMRIKAAGVGIGTSSPGNALEVARSTSAGSIELSGTATSQDVYLRFLIDDNGNEAQFVKYPSSGTGTIAGHARASNAFLITDENDLVVGATHASGDLILAAGNATAMTLLSDGKVGIGETNPGAELYIKNYQNADTGIIIDNQLSSGTRDEAGAFITLACEGGSYDPRIKFVLGGGGADWAIGVDNSNSDKFVIAGGTDTGPALETNPRLTIDGSGNVVIGGTVTANGSLIGVTVNNASNNRVFTSTGSALNAEANLVFDGTNLGIGVTSPASSLHIISPTAASSPWTSTAITFAPANYTARTWQLRYDDGGAVGNAFSIAAAGTRILYMTSAGKVGINTASPDGTLHVHEGSAGSVTAISNSSLVIESNTHNYISMLNPDGNNSGIIFGEADDNDRASIIVDGGSNDMTFTAGATVQMTLDGDNDRVGIGTTAPAHLLDIAGVSPTIRLQSTQEDSDPKIMFWDYANSPGFQMWYDGNAEDMYFDNHYTANADIIFRTHVSSSPVEVLRLTDDGKVGIGHASPDQKLSVEGHIQVRSGNWLLLRNNANDNYSYIQNADTGSEIQFATSGVKMVLTSAGNLGIGTTSPGSLLHLLAPTNTNAELKICTDDNEISRLGLYEDAAGTQHGAFFQYRGESSDVLQIGSINSGTDSVYITMTDAGKVGIGTASPISTYGGLDVSSGGMGLVVGADGDASTRTNSTNKEARIGMPHYTNAEEVFQLVTGAVKTSSNLVTIGGGASAFNAATSIKLYTAANNTTLAGTVAMTIDSSQNVGIGTTSPGVLLHVGSGDATPYGGNSSTRVGYFTAAGRADLYVRDSSNNIETIVRAGTDKCYVGSSTNHDLQFITNGSDKMVIKADGMVFVNTTGITPPGTQKMIVSANSVTSTTNWQLAIEGNNDSGVLFIEDGTKRGLVGYDAGKSQVMVGDNDGDNSWRIATNSDTIYGYTADTARLTISTGRVNAALPMTVTGADLTWTDGTDSALTIQSAGTNATWLRAEAGDELYIGANAGSGSPNYAIRILNPDNGVDFTGHVRLDGQVTIGDGSNRRYFAKATRWGYASTYRAIILGSTSATYNTNHTGAVTLAFNYDPSGNANSSFGGNGEEILFRNPTRFVLPNDADDGWHQTIAMVDGKLGLNATNPDERLEVNGCAVFSGDNAVGTNAQNYAHGIMLQSTSGQARISPISNGSNDVSLQLGGLNNGSRTSYQLQLWANGNVCVNHDNQVASFSANGADDNITASFGSSLSTTSKWNGIAFGHTITRKAGIFFERQGSYSVGRLNFCMDNTADSTSCDNSDRSFSVNMDKTVDFGYATLHADGTQALPGIAFNGDTDTGIYRVSSNVLGFSTGDTGRFFVYHNGNVGIGNSSPGDKLVVAGDCTVTGTMSKGDGDFKINHPLPELADTHYLRHSFIEGPRADLIYRGVVDLSSGTATVNIDTAVGMTEGTFEALCRTDEAQVWLQNDTGWDAVRGSVSGNILTITCQNTNSTETISWMVVADRTDPHILKSKMYGNGGRMILEPEKTAQERGYTT